MHIEPGFVAPAKVLLANFSAAALLAGHAGGLFRAPVLRTMLAAAFFSLFMQSFHMPVGPSELHFVGAMAIYLTLGYAPALFGFALGLLLQGLLFAPQDLAHLGINSLSLMVPLMAVHHSIGRRLSEGTQVLNWKEIVRLDAMYYAGVVAMVGFWLMLGETETPFLDWAAFAASYLGLAALEPVVTMTAIRMLKRQESNDLVNHCFQIRSLKLLA